MSNMQAIAGATAVGLAAVFPVKKAIDFEFAMADVLKVLDDITPKQLTALKKEIFSTSIAMGRLPKDIAAVVAAGGRLGIPLEQLGRFTNLATKVAVAFDTTEEVAGDALANIKNRLKLSIIETEKFTDTINHLADTTAAKAPAMLEIIGRISGTMAAIEMPPKFISAWSALATQVEVTPRLAASGLNMMIEQMMLMPGMMNKLLKAPSKTIEEYIKKLAKIPKAKLPDVLEKKFGKGPAGFVIKLVTNIELLNKSLGKLSDETKIQGSMQRELNKKLATTKVKMDRVRAAFTVFAIVAGTAVLPVIKAFTPILIKIGNALSRFSEAHPQLFKVAIIFGIVTAAASGLLVVLAIVGAAFGAISLPIIGIVAGITAVVAVSAALLTYWDDIAATIKSISIGGAISSIKSFLGFGSDATPRPVAGGVAGKTAAAMSGTLNGKIDFKSDTPGRAKATMESSLPGNLGMNMQPQGVF